jgi:hypothetical protein
VKKVMQVLVSNFLLKVRKRLVKRKPTQRTWLRIPSASREAPPGGFDALGIQCCSWFSYEIKMHVKK